MQIIKTKIPDVLIIEPDIFRDARGFFLESYNEQKFLDVGFHEIFVQDNISYSKRGVLRGLHYQITNVQGKLITVTNGEIFDVAVDLRTYSDYFGQFVTIILSSEQPRFFWVPPGFAHGFLVLSEDASVFYKVTDYYNPNAERTLLWNDDTLRIPWPLSKGDVPLLSDKDANGKSFALADKYYKENIQS